MDQPKMFEGAGSAKQSSELNPTVMISENGLQHFTAH